MIRGIERRRIFNDDKDRENFIERLSILLPETKTKCYAWAFMSNHAQVIKKILKHLDLWILKASPPPKRGKSSQ